MLKFHFSQTWKLHSTTTNHPFKILCNMFSSYFLFQDVVFPVALTERSLVRRVVSYESKSVNASQSQW